MKTFFNSKSIRERVLMTALLLVALATWGSSLFGRTRQFKTEWTSSAVELKDQLATLKSKAQVDDRTTKVTAKLDPARTFNAAAAFAEVNRLAQGLPSAEIGQQRTDRTENFAMNSLQVTVRQAGLEPLLKFYKELSLQAPYLNIDQCSLSVNRATPGQITATFRIYSVEVLRPASP